jgi:hypothetical protein
MVGIINTGNFLLLQFLGLCQKYNFSILGLAALNIVTASTYDAAENEKC